MTIDDIRNKARFLTSTSATSFPDTYLIVEANNALDRVSSLIMQADGRWQYDDTNNTDLPIATTGIVANQQDYTISVSHLEITRVELLDSNASWHKLIPMDQKDVDPVALTSYLSTPGLPTYYDKIGSSLFLYPAPNYTQAASLKLYFKRPPNYFITSDTTKQPGFNSLYHELIPLWIAYNYAIANGKENGSAIYAQILQKEDALTGDYSTRDKDENIQLRARQMNWR